MYVIAVVVTYQPGDMTQLLRTLTTQCTRVIVVDNGSRPAGLERLRQVCEQTGAGLVELGDNRGIAAAQNRGIALARSQGAECVLLSDQDSSPAPGMVDQLAAALKEDDSIAAVGPLPVDDSGTGDELVYVDRGWSPKRATPAELTRLRLDVPFLIASGCLIRLAALDDVGAMREDLFIDHVDLEWGVRARNRGWRIVAVPGARLHHSLGDKTVKLPGRRQPVHLHAPVRNYYLMRNTIALVKWTGFPPRWRVRYAYWALKYGVFNALCADHRAERARMLQRGLVDGLRGRLGRFDRS
ncbi:glycosyltransferase family 2 protein [Actinomyces oricola]|uniref:glycosyltransferase family 2 protein n=1 Tax=Actinomyces oricola TaxID=206043 RepID=UPI0030C7E5E5